MGGAPFFAAGLVSSAVGAALAGLPWLAVAVAAAALPYLAIGAVRVLDLARAKRPPLGSAR